MTNQVSPPRRIRVMQIINSFRPGGAEMLVFDLATRMDKEKFEVLLCSIGGRNDEIEGGLRKELESKGITTLSLDKPARRRRLQAIWKLSRWLRENGVHIVHTHCPSPDFYGTLGALLARTPVVVSTIHSVQGYSALVERILGNFTSNYVAISETVKRYAISDLLISPAKVEVIYNAVDMKRFSGIAIDRQTKLLELGIPGSSKVVSAVGRITEEKGHTCLLEAAEDVLAEFPNAHFLVVGDDRADAELSRRLRETLRAKNLESKITFTGVRKDVAEILAVTDVFVLPSLWEGLSVALLEAMATGTAVIVTDVGSNREVVTDGDNGFVIRPRDPEKLAQRLKELLAHPQRARTLGMRAKAAVKERFGIERMVGRYEQLYLRHVRKLR